VKFFLDTANIDEIKACASFGFLDGVTTNPSLMAREGIANQRNRILEICSITDGPVSAEVLATDTEGMIEEAQSLFEIAGNVAVKIPLTMPGLAATRALADSGKAVNLTLVFSPLQALLAAKAGAAFVSPFVGRLDDVGEDGMQLVEDIVSIYTNYAFETEVIVASIRSPQHVLRAALAGVDICTVPFKVIEQLAQHPLTDKGLAAFLEDHRKASAKSTPPSQH
jgi:transaldolase